MTFGLPTARAYAEAGKSIHGYSKNAVPETGHRVFTVSMIVDGEVIVQ